VFRPSGSGALISKEQAQALCTPEHPAIETAAGTRATGPSYTVGKQAMNELWIIIPAGILLIWRFTAIATKGRRAVQWWNRGVQAVEQGDYDAAERALRRCVRLSPISAPARRLYARALISRGKIREAEHQVRMATQLEPRNGEGFLDLGFFLSACAPERNEEAVEALEKAVALAPNLRGVIARDERLRALHELPRFQALVENKARNQA